jgi:outer membrane protein, heavy metal efflux system
MNAIIVGRVVPLIVTVGALSLTACVTYRPHPLSGADVEAALHSPPHESLQRAASDLKRPWLRPLELDFTKPLTDDELAVIAVIASPDLRALRTKQGVADAQVFESGLLPDPQLSAGFDKVLSPNDPSLTSAYAGSLSLDVLGGLVTRHLERGIRRAAAEQQRDDIAWAEWSAAGQARLLARRWFYQSQAQALTREAWDTAERALKRALSAAAARDIKGDELETRRIAAADAREKALAAERDADATRLDLNQLLGFKPEETWSLAPPLALTPWQQPDVDALFATARRQRLDLKALEHGYAAQEMTLHRAVLGQFPRLGITVNRARDTSNIHTVGPAVSLDLPLWNRNRGAIATGGANREQLHAEYVLRLSGTRADIAALVAALDRDERARSELTAQLPAIERTAGAFAEAATHHDVTQTDADAARATAIDKTLALLALEQSCAEQRIALALATGSALSDQLGLP